MTYSDISSSIMTASLTNYILISKKMSLHLQQ